MALPNIDRAGVVLADKTTTRHCDRLSVARAAQRAAITRHAPEPAPAPALAGTDNERVVDRNESQDLHAWND